MHASSTETSDWFASQWELPAPESQVLLNGVNDRDTRPFDLAVMELVARKNLALTEVEERGPFNRLGHTSVITKGVEPQRPTQRSLAAVWNLFTRTQLHTFDDGTIGLSAADFAHAAARQYRPLSRFTTDEVLPTLVRRGFFTRQDRRFLGIFGSTRYVLTPSGEAAKADLQRRIETGKAEFAGWAREDPDRALLYAGYAGPSLLLMPFLFSDVADLRRQQDSGESVPYVAASSTDARPDFEPTDVSTSGTAEAGASGGLQMGTFGGLEFGGFDFAAFEGLQTAISGFSAGFDSALSGVGGWGGGDGGGWAGGGGGDGGGGGGGDGGGGGGV